LIIIVHIDVLDGIFCTPAPHFSRAQTGLSHVYRDNSEIPTKLPAMPTPIFANDENECHLQVPTFVTPPL